MCLRENDVVQGEKLAGRDYLQMRLEPLIRKIENLESGSDQTFPFLLNLKPAIEKMISDEPLPDRADFPERPIFIDAATAHREKIVTYDEFGVATFKHPELSRLPQFKEKPPSRRKVKIGLDKQYPNVVGAIMQSLNKSLSNIENSPRTEDGKTLRQMYEEESRIFEEKKAEAIEKGGWEPPEYGTYVFMPKTGTLHLIAPEILYRLSLLTSTSVLYKGPNQKTKWQEVRKIIEPKVVGAVGASIGGGMFKGLDNDSRQLEGKIADFDRLEAGNFNRIQGPELLFDIVGSRAEQTGEIFNLKALRKSKKPDDRLKADFYEALMKDPANIPWKNKAKQVALHVLNTHPQKKIDLYEEGIDMKNVLQFLLGDGKKEKPVDMVLEEVDKGRIKVEMRVLCKILGIPLMMVSDFGAKTIVQFYDWPKRNDGIGYKGVSDEEVYEKLLAMEQENTPASFFKLVDAICGHDFRDYSDNFGDWVRDTADPERIGKSEQMGASLPQKGSAALDAAGEATEQIINYFLGHDIPKHYIIDHQHHAATIIETGYEDKYGIDGEGI